MLTSAWIQSGFRTAATPWLLATALLLAAMTAVAAEDAQSQTDATAPAESRSTPPPAPSFPAQPPPAGKPGFLHELGRWWQDSLANFNAGMKDAQGRMSEFNAQADVAAKETAAATQEAMRNAADAAKEAATAFARLPNTRVIEVRERCAAAANGAPDCRAAATSVCRGKGFNTGQALDIQSAQKCPAAVWLSGRMPRDGECAVETHVLRAVCQ
jgi:hypothetical protein